MPVTPIKCKGVRTFENNICTVVSYFSIITHILYILIKLPFIFLTTTLPLYVNKKGEVTAHIIIKNALYTHVHAPKFKGGHNQGF